MVLCISISTYYSYLGFFPTFGPIVTKAFVAVIALGLFASGALLQMGRDKKSSSDQLFALLLFLVFASFSTSSNFTAFYTSSVETKVKENAFATEKNKFDNSVAQILAELEALSVDEAEVIKSVLQYYHSRYLEDLNRITAVINSSQVFSDGQREYAYIKDQLSDLAVQATDPGRPGCGERCRQHITNITSKVSPTKIAIPSASMTNQGVVDSFLRLFEENVWRNYCDDPKYQSFLLLENILEEQAAGTNCAGNTAIKTNGSLALLRAKIEIPTNQEINTVSNFLTDLNEATNVLRKLVSMVKQADTALVDDSGLLISEVPVSIEKAITLFSDENTVGTSIDIAAKGRRDSLMASLLSDDFMTIRMNLLDSESKKINLRAKPNITDIVIEGVPIRQFFVPLKEKLTEIVSKYNIIIGPDFAKDFPEINIEKGNIGKIKETLVHGFIEMPSVKDTVYSLLLGFAFDILPILFAFIAFKGHQPRQKEYDPVMN